MAPAPTTGATSTTTTPDCIEFVTYTAPNSKIPDQMRAAYCLYPNAAEPALHTT